MGDDPERSIVNARSRSHDIKNLFIVDGGIWITSGGRIADLPVTSNQGPRPQQQE